jgi:hypothetical protein
LLTSILAFGLQQSGVLVPKIPILYSLKQKQNKQKTRSAFEYKAFQGHMPTPPSLHGQCWVSPCEGYSLFLGTGLYGGPFLP